MRRAVFLDRDGVLTRAIVRNGKPVAPSTEADLDILPGAHEALARLRAAGFYLVVVTNQPEVARGTLPPAVLDRMHARLSRELPIDEIRVCPHDDGDGCGCRKPRAGMLTDAAAAAALSLRESVMVGDRWRDIEAGRHAGCATVFIDHRYDERRPEQPDAVVHSMGEAADWILSRP